MATRELADTTRVSYVRAWENRVKDEIGNIKAVSYTHLLEKQEQHRQNIADERIELLKAQEGRQAQRKPDGSATTGATRPLERPATALSLIHIFIGA